MSMLVRHILQVAWSTLRFGASTRNIAIVVVVVGGFIVLTLALAAQTAAPFVLYPFA